MTQGAQGAFRFGGRRQVQRPRYVERAREADVLHACLDLLRLRGVVAWRQNQGAMKQAGRNGRERFIRFAGIRGISDIIGVLPDGRFLAIECKRPGQRPTPDQLAFLEAVNRAGGLGIVVYDVAELDAAIRQEDRS